MVGAEETEKEATPLVSPNQKQKQTPLSQLTKEELEARVKQLEAHNTQLRNLLSKRQANGASDTSFTHIKSQKRKEFDFSKHSRRHVALKLCYLGWNYQGFAVQEDSQNTIEAELFAALLKTRLIESRETSNYHRCGRTDKGVSAFDQVISITLRSKVTHGLGVLGPKQGVAPLSAEGLNEQKEEQEVEEEEGEEINYVQLLNRVLPQEIRALAWCPVPQGFSARFDCCRRTYKYFFPRGSLDLQAMNEAGQHLVGEHDFRNLCKMDVANGVVNFKRHILSVRVARVDKESDGGDASDGGVGGDESASGGDGYVMCVATIQGNAFLWHQVRAVMAVLFLVGEGKEQPSVVPRLLDVHAHPRKPQYSLASDLPLNLWAVDFDGIAWRWDEAELHRLLAHIQGMWMQQAVRGTMIRGMLQDLEAHYKDLVMARQEQERVKEKEEKTDHKEPGLKRRKEEENEEEQGWEVRQQVVSLTSEARTKVYRPLLSRPTCESLEKRVEHYVKRKRLDPTLLQKLTSPHLT